jgi:hypothetical protein
MLVYVFSIIPKNHLHNLVAHHIDHPFSFEKKGYPLQINKYQYNCGVVFLIATSPYTHDSITNADNKSIFYITYSNPPVRKHATESFAQLSLRGPPLS